MISTTINDNVIELPPLVEATLARGLRHGLIDDQYALLRKWSLHMVITRGFSANTVRNYLDSTRELIVWLNENNTDLGNVTEQHIENWLKSLAVYRGNGPATRSAKLTAIKQFFEWRARKGEQDNPARFIVGPKQPIYEPRKFLPQQLQKIFSSIDRKTPIGQRDYAILILLLSTGIRRAEVSAANIASLSLRQKVGVIRVYGKGFKERTLSFEGPAVDALHEWFVYRSKINNANREALFLSMTGPYKGRRLGIDGVDDVLRRAIVRSKLKLAPRMALHTLRSTFATALFDDGKDIEQIRILMGHRKLETTRRYIAISDRQMRTRLPADRVNTLIGSQPTRVPRYVENKLSHRQGSPS